MILEWKDQTEKRWYKCLDHQSFNFKLREKRETNSKSFLQEIKSLSTKENKNENEKMGGTTFSPFYTAFREKEWE